MGDIFKKSPVTTIDHLYKDVSLQILVGYGSALYKVNQDATG